MNFQFRYIATMGIMAAGLINGAVQAHPASDHEHEHIEDTASSPIFIAQKDSSSSDRTTGQGDMTFKVLLDSSVFPTEHRTSLKKAHGGFAVDRREGRGEIYFALPGTGIIRIPSDLSGIEILPTDKSMKSQIMHNATIWYTKDNTPYLTFPGVNAAKIFTTKLDGTLVHTLKAPSDSMVSYEPKVQDYFKNGGKFVPTDVEIANNRFYIATGYSNLDYVLTASVHKTDPFSATWSPLAFGGRGEGPGEFGTGHGITLEPDGKALSIADRPNAEIDRFDLTGSYLDTINLPEGAFPCDTDYVDDYLVVGCLHGPDREKGAPIYILKDNEIVSTVMIKEDLGLGRFQHIHNAVMVKRNGKFYIIAQAWNPGGFAILEQITP